MEFHRIREELQAAMQIEHCKKELQNIKHENDDKLV